MFPLGQQPLLLQQVPLDQKPEKTPKITAETEVTPIIMEDPVEVAKTETKMPKIVPLNPVCFRWLM